MREPPVAKPEWASLLVKPDGEERGDGYEACAKSVGTFDREARRRLQNELDAIGREDGDNRTGRASWLIFMDYGRSLEDGWPLLKEWNARRHEPHDERELRRRMTRALDYKSGERRGDKVWTVKVKKTAAPKKSKPTRTAKDWPPLASQVAAKERPPVRAFATHMPTRDKLTGGGNLTRGLTTIVAPTGAGKTGFVLSDLLHLARQHGVPSIYASTELEEHEVADRLAAQILGYPHLHILRGEIDRARVRRALDGIPIHIIGREHGLRTAGMDGVLKLREAVERMRDRHRQVPALGVDYLQMLVQDDPKNVRMGVTALAYAFHDMAQDLDTAVIAVSSTARSFYGRGKGDREDPITYLASAKESGDIEYACTSLMYLDVGPEVEGVHAARVVVAKARFGQRGFVGAHFEGATGRWIEYEDALAEMDTESEGGEEKDDAKVIAAVLANPGLAWNKLRGKTGIGTDRVDDVRDRLIASGKLIRHEGPRKAIVLSVANGAAS